MDLKTFNFSELIRYFMTGFLFIAIVVSPLVINKDIATFIELKNTSAVIIMTTAFVFGFLIDQLKIYQIIKKYKNIKKNFRKDIQEILEIDDDLINTKFSFITSYAKNTETHDLEKKRAEWILAINVTVMCLFTILLWIVLYSLNYLPTLNYYLFVAYFIIALKLHSTALKELNKSNKEFLLFCKNNKEKLKKEIV